MSTLAITTLWRPVGGYELVAIIDAGWTRFPPRLAEQPIFYPVCNRGYAEQIAYKWNLGDPNSAYAGFVTEFSVPTALADRYQHEIVGGREHEELWVPAEELDDFCQAFVQPIRVVAGQLGPAFPTIAPDWPGGTGMLDQQGLNAVLDYLRPHRLSGGPLTRS